MPTSSSRSPGSSLERALHHWRERGVLLKMEPSDKPAEPLTIAISREHGAGGSTIAEALSKATGWPVYGRQLVDTIAEDSGVRAQLLEHLDEKRPNWFEECLNAFYPEKTMTGAGYAIRLREVLVALAGHGDCIILGRGAAQFLDPKVTLRVRLVAPQDYRVAEIAARLQISPRDAAQKVKEVDQGRASFVNRYFQTSLADFDGYDLTINTSRFKEGTCVALITAALAGRREMLETSSSH